MSLFSLASGDRELVGRLCCCRPNELLWARWAGNKWPPPLAERASPAVGSVVVVVVDAAAAAPAPAHHQPARLPLGSGQQALLLWPPISSKEEQEAIEQRQGSLQAPVCFISARFALPCFAFVWSGLVYSVWSQRPSTDSLLGHENEMNGNGRQSVAPAHLLCSHLFGAFTLAGLVGLSRWPLV